MAPVARIDRRRVTSEAPYGRGPVVLRSAITRRMAMHSFLVSRTATRLRTVTVPMLSCLAVACTGPNPPADVPSTDAAVDSASDIVSVDAVDGSMNDVPVMDAPDATPPDAPPEDVILGPAFCSLGTDVPGLRVPAGFCVRKYADVPHPRTMVIASNGDLLIGSPGLTYVTTTGPGTSGVVVLSDDDRDGTAERHDFLTGVNDIHGVAIGGGFLYYTTMTSIFRTPYRDGQRAETPGMREDLRMPGEFAGQRATHPLARSLGGNMFSSRSMSPSCGNPIGEIYRVSMGTATMIARGFRNPMYIRCHFAHELCAATELGDDGSAMAMEKLLILSTSGDYGYPGCDGRGTLARCGGSCASITVEDIRFPINDTPFGFDWERGQWPEPYRHGLFVALHGSYFTSPGYRNAGLVYVSTDPATGRPRAGATVTRFLEGLGVMRGESQPNTIAIHRPADVAFAPDGRLFFTADQGNAVYWVAPVELRRRGG